MPRTERELTEHGWLLYRSYRLSTRRIVALLFLDTVPRLLPQGKPASAVHLDGFRSEPSDSWPDSGPMKWELVTALFTVWERSLLSHLLVGTWIQPTYLTFPGLGWGRNLAFNTLDKAYSSRFSDIIPRLASLAEQGRPQCSKAGESQSSCSLASPSVHILDCSRVCWKLNLQKTLLRWRNREWSRNLLSRRCVRMPVLASSHYVNSQAEFVQWGLHLNGSALHNSSCLWFDGPCFSFGLLNCWLLDLLTILLGLCEPTLYCPPLPYQLSELQLVSFWPPRNLSGLPRPLKVLFSLFPSYSS